MQTITPGKAQQQEREAGRSLRIQSEAKSEHVGAKLESVRACYL